MTTYDRPKPAGTPTWIDLTAPDIEAARTFYQTLFGWEYDIGGPEYGGYTTARLGSRPSAGLSTPMEGSPPMPAIWSLYFASDDVKSDAAKATELGASVVVQPMEVGPFGSMAICQDPTGAFFGLWQAGEHIGFQVSDEPGTSTWYELYSPNAKQARDFYTAFLGATDDPMPGDMEYYVLKHGDAQLGGIMQIDPAWGELPPHWAMYFAVADADAAVATISGNGGNIMGTIDDTPFGRMAAVSDPQGATFKIIQLPPR